MKKFTLLELMVVVAVIAILVSILLPSIGRARAQSRTLVCASNMRQQGILIKTQLMDHSNTYVTQATGDIDGSESYHGPSYYNTGKLNPTEAGSNSGVYQVRLSYHYQLPVEASICSESFQADGLSRQYERDYAFNMRLHTTIYSTQKYNKVKESELTKASETVLVSESGKYWINGDTAHRISVKHKGGKLNLLFADGHITSSKYTNFWNNKQWLEYTLTSQTSFGSPFTLYDGI